MRVSRVAILQSVVTYELETMMLTKAKEEKQNI